MHRTFAVVLFGFSLLMTGQASALGLGIAGDGCPVSALPPKPTDTCSVELERTFGILPKTDTICPKSTVMNDLLGEPCLRTKLSLAGINDYTVPSSTVRTEGYQQHLVEVWDRHKDHKDPRLTADQIRDCTKKRNIILAEQEGPPRPGHGLGFQPSGQSHSTNAFDIPGAIADKLMSVPNVQVYLDTASPGSPACNLKWGGSFGDKYHFSTKE